MTHSLLKRLAARGHEVTVVVRDGDAPWDWEGITVTGGSLPRGEFHSLPDGDVLVYHAEFWEGSVETWTGPSVAICHNARMGVRLGLRNHPPTVATVNSETMNAELVFGRKRVVHPPLPAVRPLSGERVTLINLERTSKVGPFWELTRLMPDVAFLGVRGGYGDQEIPRGRRRRNVELLDPVPPALMDDAVWSRTRVLLVPSATESWSMVASEAMSRGIPVIANPVPGLIENLDGVGVWVDREDTNQWVRAIRWVLAGWAEHSAAVLERATEQFDRHEAEATAWCELVEGL